MVYFISILISLFACIGFCTTAFLIYIRIKHRNVFKALKSFKEFYNLGFRG